MYMSPVSPTAIMASSAPCPFLDLPVELHLLIFDYCTPSGCITVSSIDEEEDDTSPESVTQRSITSKAQKKSIPGLPAGRAPRVKHAFDQQLLEDPARGQVKAHEEAKREEAQALAQEQQANAEYAALARQEPTTSLSGFRWAKAADRETEYQSTAGPESSQSDAVVLTADAIESEDLPHHTSGPPDHLINDDRVQGHFQYRAERHDRGKQPFHEPDRYLCMAIPALHLTCRQIHHELTKHRPHLTSHPHDKRELDVFLSFPDGVCIAAHRYQHMLKIARSINVTGVYDMSQLPDPQAKPKDASAASGLSGGANPLRTGDVSISEAELAAMETLEVGLAPTQVKALETVTNIAIGMDASRSAETAYKADEAAQAQSVSRKNSTASTSSSYTTASTSRLSRSDTMDIDQTPIISRTSSARSSSEGPREPLPGERLTIDPPTTSDRSPSPTPSELRRAAGNAYAPLLNIRIFHPNEPAQNPFYDFSQPPGDVKPSVWYTWTTGQDFPAHLAHLDTSPPRLVSRRHGRFIPNPSNRPGVPFPYTRLRNRPPMASRQMNNPYATIWTHSLSPGPAALSNIYGGDIKLAVARGRFGTGIDIVGKCNFGLGRYLSSHWPRLDGEEGKKVGGVRGWLCPEEWKENAGV